MLLRLSRIIGIVLLTMLCSAAFAGAPGGWFGPNYQAPPAGANTGTCWDATASSNLTWFNWWDGDRGLWYYAYQVGNFNFQPHIASLLMGLNAEQVAATTYEGHAYALRPASLLNYWNPAQVWVGETAWFGWASDPGHECLPGCGTSTYPYFEITSTFAPGPACIKLTDLDYYELHQAGFPDPMSLFVDIPCPVIIPEPGSLLVMGSGLLGLAGVVVRGRRR
jgi:hypothetical protein